VIFIATLLSRNVGRGEYRSTTELYLDAQTTFHDSTVATGFCWENRFRPLKREYFINPVLYVEYEHINGADKILKELEGHDIENDFLTPNAEARDEVKNELEHPKFTVDEWRSEVNKFIDVVNKVVA
jgi:hypothetical protein